MPNSHHRASLLDDVPAKTPAADPGAGSNNARTIAMVCIFLVLGACVAYIYWPESVPKQAYEPPGDAPAQPGAKPVKPPEPPPPIPDAPGVRPTITG